MSNEENYPEGVKVRSLYKAVKLLDYFNSAHPERGISELAELSGMLKSSVYNIMSTFESCGVVEKNPKTSQYRLGLKILEWSNALSQNDVFGRVIRPFLEELTDRTGETVFLATPYGTNIIYLEAACPKGAMSVRSIKGVVAPMYCTSLGKAILSRMEPSMIEQVIAAGLEAFTPYTITDAQRFREEIDHIRAVGYSVDNMEHEYGIKCVGVPICNGRNQVIGGISLSGPSLRFNEQQIVEYAKLLDGYANQIRNHL